MAFVSYFRAAAVARERRTHTKKERKKEEGRSRRPKQVGKQARARESEMGLNLNPALAGKRAAR